MSADVIEDHVQIVLFTCPSVAGCCDCQEYSHRTDEFLDDVTRDLRNIIRGGDVMYHPADFIGREELLGGVVPA